MSTANRIMCVEEPIQVRTYDVDYMQIVNNTVYVKWFENLRMAILDQYFPLEEMLKENNSPILSETHVKYHRPVTLHSHPTGRAWMDELDRGRWVIKFEIFEGEQLYCEGMQMGYYFNMTRMRPTRFPDTFVAYYKSLCEGKSIAENTDPKC